MLKTQLMNKKKPLYLWSLHSSYEWQENEEKIKDIECWQLLYGKWKQCISERNWMGRSFRAYIQGSLSEKVTFKLKLERRTKQEFHREKKPNQRASGGDVPHDFTKLKDHCEHERGWKKWAECNETKHCTTDRPGSVSVLSLLVAVSSAMLLNPRSLHFLISKLGLTWFYAKIQTYIEWHLTCTHVT